MAAPMAHMADLLSVSNSKHSRKFERLLSKVGESKYKFERDYLCGRQYDRIADLNLLNNMSFWGGIHFCVRGHWAFIFKSSSPSSTLLDVLCVKGASLYKIEGFLEFREFVIMFKEHPHWNEQRPMLRRKGLCCCWKSSPEERSEWLFQAPNQVDQRNWFYFLQSLATSTKCRAREEKPRAKADNLKPVMSDNTDYLKIKDLFDFYKESDDEMDVEGFTQLLLTAKEWFDFVPSYTSPEELMEKADENLDGTITFEELYRLMKAWMEDHLKNMNAAGMIKMKEAAGRRTSAMFQQGSTEDRRLDLRTYYQTMRYGVRGKELDRLYDRVTNRWKLGHSFQLVVDLSLHFSNTRSWQAVEPERVFVRASSNLAALRECFDAVKAAESGVLSQSAYEKAMSTVGSAWACQQMLTVLDGISGSSTEKARRTYSWEQLVKICTPVWQLKTIFEICDQDSSGSLAVEELVPTVDLLTQMFGKQSAIEQMKRLLQDSAGDEISLDYDEFLSTFGGVTMAQLRVSLQIKPFEAQEDTFEVEAKVLGTVAELWQELDKFEWMPYGCDSLSFSYDGHIIENRMQTLRESGVCEGAVIHVVDAFDPFGHADNGMGIEASAWGDSEFDKSDADMVVTPLYLN